MKLSEAIKYAKKMGIKPIHGSWLSEQINESKVDKKTGVYKNGSACAVGHVILAEALKKNKGYLTEENYRELASNVAWDIGEYIDSKDPVIPRALLKKVDNKCPVERCNSYTNEEFSPSDFTGDNDAKYDPKTDTYTRAKKVTIGDMMSHLFEEHNWSVDKIADYLKKNNL